MLKVLMLKNVHHIGLPISRVPVHADQASNKSAEKHTLETLAKMAYTAGNSGSGAPR
jgi:hypothetical protein